MATKAGMAELSRLLDDVVRSRADHVEARRGAPGDLGIAALAHLRALEIYALELDRHGWPLPPNMGSEIRLQRSVCGAWHRSGTSYTMT